MEDASAKAEPSLTKRTAKLQKQVAARAVELRAMAVNNLYFQPAPRELGLSLGRKERVAREGSGRRSLRLRRAACWLLARPAARLRGAAWPATQRRPAPVHARTADPRHMRLAIFGEIMGCADFARDHLYVECVRSSGSTPQRA